MNEKRYILIVDDEEDLRDIYEMVLRNVVEFEILQAVSGKEALDIIARNGKPFLIISDLRMPNGDGKFLYDAIRQNKWTIPFIICSSDSLASLGNEFPEIYGHVEKPKVIAPLQKLVSTLMSSQHLIKYVPIRISFLLRWGSIRSDLYIKLSDQNFKKVSNAEEAFTTLDADKYLQKGISYLYLTDTEARKFLLEMERSLSSILEANKITPPEITVLTFEALETVERISKTLGWDAEVIKSSKHAINLAIKTVSLEPDLIKILKSKLQNTQSKFSLHIGMISLLSCGFCQYMGWVTEMAQMKLGMAALIHDITVDESVYDDIYLWDEASSDPRNKTPEVLAYKNHPIEASKLAVSMKNLPPDVDQIILQHHETRDGTGFPRGLTATRISPMATLFIFTQDFVNFLGETQDFEGRIKEFIQQRENVYNVGNLKKIFDAFKNGVGQ